MKKLLMAGLLLFPAVSFSQQAQELPKVSSHRQPTEKMISLEDLRWKEISEKGEKVELHYKRLDRMTEEDRKFITDHPEIFTILGKEEKTEGGKP